MMTTLKKYYAGRSDSEITYQESQEDQWNKVGLASLKMGKKLEAALTKVSTVKNFVKKKDVRKIGK